MALWKEKAFIEKFCWFEFPKPILQIINDALSFLLPANQSMELFFRNVLNENIWFYSKEQITVWLSFYNDSKCGL